MMLRLLPLTAVVALATPLAALAQAPTSVTCDLGHVAVSATIDASDGSVIFDDGGKPQRYTASMSGSRVDFDDGAGPITQSYAINLASLRIDRWVATAGEPRSHLDSGRCRAAAVAASTTIATVLPTDTLRTP